MNISEVKDLETLSKYCNRERENCHKCKVRQECTRLFRELRKQKYAPQIYIEQKLTLIIKYNRKQKLSHLLNDP